MASPNSNTYKNGRKEPESSTVEGKESRRPTENEISDLRDFEAKAIHNKTIIGLMKKIDGKEERKIGHLAFHPSFEVSSRTPGYLKDWALIELDNKKFLNAPDNKVFIGSAVHSATQDFPGLPLGREFGKDLDNGFLSLVPNNGETNESRAFRVGKRGSATNLTFGVKSGIEAVVQRPTVGGGDMYTWEMLIVPLPGTQKFADRGDSGSCIFDFHGRIVGLLTGSAIYGKLPDWRGIPTIKGDPSGSRELKRYSGNNIPPEAAAATAKDDLDTWDEGTDVTFAALIEWVLDDIQDFTGLKPRLA
ncbi:hypothetical protein DL769_011435 [Monosporascus sp. CRB-8-3]|nr:hypothetical protein DL769_011435 [Monosporascus sp. CRB-8-3]